VDYYDGLIQKIKATRDSFRLKLEAMGWFSYPSQGNLIFTEPVNSRGEKGPDVAKSLFDFLFREKILVRYFGNDTRTDSFLRISVGSDAEMKSLNDVINQWLKNA